MKEFEKQWKIQQEINCWGESGHDKKVAKVIWKAALRWAEDLFVQLNSFEVEETINKELRNGVV